MSVESFFIITSDSLLSYSADEEESRFAIFVDNLAVIDARNAAEGSDIHGITKFSDLTQEEFASRYLLSKLPDTMPATPLLGLKPLDVGATVNVCSLF